MKRVKKTDDPRNTFPAQLFVVMEVDFDSPGAVERLFPLASPSLSDTAQSAQGNDRHVARYGLLEIGRVSHPALLPLKRPYHRRKAKAKRGAPKSLSARALRRRGA